MKEYNIVDVDELIKQMTKQIRLGVSSEMHQVIQALSGGAGFNGKITPFIHSLIQAEAKRQKVQIPPAPKMGGNRRGEGTMRLYVVGMTHWQGDDWTPIAGSFGTRKEANEAAQELRNESHDLKAAYYTEVMSLSALKKDGWTLERIQETVFAYEADRQREAEMAANEVEYDYNEPIELGS